MFIFYRLADLMVSFAGFAPQNCMGT
jgi:hypothetical protein